jgi:hypothetical protein
MPQRNRCTGADTILSWPSSGAVVKATESSKEIRHGPMYGGTLLCGSTPNVGRSAQPEGTAFRDFQAFSPRFDEGDAAIGVAPRLLSPLPSAL